MTTSIIWNCITTFVVIVRGANALFEAVTFHPHVEEYYYLLTKRDAPERTESIGSNVPKDFVDRPRITLDINTKNKLCLDIFSSGYFDMFSEDPVDTEEALAELRTNHKHIFDNILGQKSRFSIGGEMSQVTETRWVHNILLPNVKSGQSPPLKIGDYVFTCLTRSRVTRRSRVYFVSDGFNVAIDAPASQNLGHFILSPGDDDKILVKAIAEEPAHATTTDLEMRYWSYRKTNQVAESEFADPVCRLGILHKNRICSVVLHSLFFRGKIKFWPHEDLLNPKCHKMKISFRTESTKQKIKNRLRSFKEWMLSCPAVPIARDGRKYYFISRAAKSGEAFVYSRNGSTGQIFLENLSSGISSISLNTDKRTLNIAAL